MKISCLSDEEVALFAEGKLAPKERRAFLKHLEKCPQCTLLVSAVSLACDLEAANAIAPATAVEAKMYHDWALRLTSDNPVTREFKMRLFWNEEQLTDWRHQAVAVLREPSVAFMGINLTSGNEDCLYPSVNLQVSQNQLTLRFSAPFPKSLTFDWLEKSETMKVNDSGILKIPLPDVFKFADGAADPKVVLGVGNRSGTSELIVPVVLG